MGTMRPGKGEVIKFSNIVRRPLRNHMRIRWPSKKLQEKVGCLGGRNIESAKKTMGRTKVAQRKLAPYNLG